MNFEQAQAALIAAGKTLHQQGWVPATSGNFSARLASGELAITASGFHKGQLENQHIMRVDSEGVPLDPLRPSAETALHVQLYQSDPMIQVVLHTHSVGAVVAAGTGRSTLSFSGLEILKAFAGNASHNVTVDIPIFDNTQNIAALAQQVRSHMLTHGLGVAYLIRGHGLYTWGPDMASCMRHLEALEYLFEYARLSRQS